MAKLIYEDDLGEQTTIEISTEVSNDFKEYYGINVWEELFKTLETIVKEDQTKE